MDIKDIRILALLTGASREFLSLPEDELLGVVYHELGHIHHQGGFESFYDSLPNDLAIRLMVDKRTLDWLLANASAFISADKGLSLADRLDRGVDADIWRETDDLESDDQLILYFTKSNMKKAARLLRKFGLGDLDDLDK
jgi:hypothetical protein